jgi:hypothetical protein
MPQIMMMMMMITIIHKGLDTWGKNDRRVEGCSLETQSDPMDMNNNILLCKCY